MLSALVQVLAVIQQQAAAPMVAPVVAVKDLLSHFPKLVAWLAIWGVV